MKKSLFLLLLMASFSAYALNGNSYKPKTNTTHKTGLKKNPVRSFSPVADLLYFSFAS